MVRIFRKPSCFVSLLRTKIHHGHSSQKYVRHDSLKEVIDDIASEEQKPVDSLMTIAFKLIFKLNEDYLDRIDDMNKARESLETSKTAK